VKGWTRRGIRGATIGVGKKQDKDKRILMYGRAGLSVQGKGRKIGSGGYGDVQEC